MAFDDMMKGGGVLSSRGRYCRDEGRVQLLWSKAFALSRDIAHDTI